MKDTDREENWIGDMAREHYNRPPPTPREEIWLALEERIAAETAGVFPLEEARRRRGLAERLRGSWWMAVAATVVLATGIGIGRWTGVPDDAGAGVGSVADATSRATSRRLTPAGRLAAVEHLSRSEPLLALVKSDVARGSVDREVGEWARKLLGETRFLLDSGLPMDPEVRSLMEDLELILLQATLAAEGGLSGDRAREEVALLGEGMEERRVLPRIQAVLPTAGAGLAGT